MKIVLTGSTGQVGAAIMRAGVGQHDIVALTREDVDITDEQSVNAILQQHQPDLVINAAAYTAVDRAEEERELVTAVNLNGVEYLAKACEKLSVPLLHYSTDYVFPGEPGAIYTETCPTAPCNYYGQSKLRGEQAIMQHTSRYIILRVSGVFALNGRNFIHAILNAARTQSQLRVVADQYAGPTSADAIALTSLLLAGYVQQPDCAWGIYHYTGTPFVSWHTLAQHCIAQAQHYTTLAVKHIQPITTEEYAAPAPRPLHPQLDCQKIESQFAVTQPKWEEDINMMIKAHYANHIHT